MEAESGDRSDIETAADGRAAIEAVGTSRPDAVVLEARLTDEHRIEEVPRVDEGDLPADARGELVEVDALLQQIEAQQEELDAIPESQRGVVHDATLI